MEHGTVGGGLLTASHHLQSELLEARVITWIGVAFHSINESVIVSKIGITQISITGFKRFVPFSKTVNGLFISCLVFQYWWRIAVQWLLIIILYFLYANCSCLSCNHFGNIDVAASIGTCTSCPVTIILLAQTIHFTLCINHSLIYLCWHFCILFLHPCMVSFSFLVSWSLFVVEAYLTFIMSNK